MASLPSVAVSGNIKLDQDFRKHPTSFISSEKSGIANVSYQKSQTIVNSDGSSEPRSLDFREALVMIREGSKVESSYYVPLLQECIDRNSASDAQVVHGHIIKTGSHQDLFVTTFLVNVYAKCRIMENARKVFDKLSRRNVVSWTALMSGYVHNSRPELSIRVFLEMLEAGAYPTNYTLGIVLNASSTLYSIELGKQLHAYSIKYQIDFDTSIGNSLCSLYSKCGNLESAFKAFKKIKEKNVISWTSAISACGDNGDASKGLAFFTEMLSEGIEPNEYTLTSALSLCCTMLSLGAGIQIHSLVIKLGYELNLPVRNAIMYLYLKCGMVNEARKLFNGMEAMSLITWNAMIAGHAQIIDLAEDDLSAYQSGTEALNIFLKLNRSGVKPDLFTFSSILTVCSSMVALEQGEQVHAQSIKSGFLSDIVVATALVNMYNKCGSIEKASKVFIEMSTRTLISWTSMIAGFAQHGRTQQALQLFEDMRIAGVRPNQVTFVSVLSACSHAGMVNEALGYFESMKKDYRIKPVMDHYACLIDMFVRLGRLDEAFGLVKKMDFEPNEFIWSTLVAGCRTHGNLDRGFYAAERLLKLKPKDTETYVMLLNMYISVERWKDVSRVRKMMKEEKLGKLEEWSWITIKDKVHSFKPNDKSHPQSEDVQKYVESLTDQVKSLGYKAVESLELTDEDAETTLFSSTSFHSEKLAIAFGLLNTPNAAPIRVIKNISMCRDCHNFVKFISLLTSREIIIRDSKCLHKFVNGKCSCGDFGALL
ncbi:putative tetratricopeptide-like helical domain, DYW domain-containing protein [Rosa chinensis]|uniref:Putative tetratricopeptide-like helical domain, DYW domain-containing protein n=1 Tax=Rosa chinensis TaxID=74649 RepID=A0A2P6PG98_ROSCH|nr:pentatricopeptide repeat-containing protein At3g24000, mitochondrial isoform X2 [Rosa chinensis]PRQ20918.1 putative tetratricopeptide-like helical domain, DYW domain-containing protein [Rosa chinensis]